MHVAMHDENSTSAALSAMREGYEPISIADKGKAPSGGWRQQRWQGKDEAAIRDHFDAERERGSGNIGLQLGTTSGGLVDIDFDSPLALRFRDILIPPTPMETGRTPASRSP